MMDDLQRAVYFGCAIEGLVPQLYSPVDPLKKIPEVLWGSVVPHPC